MVLKIFEVQRTIGSRLQHRPAFPPLFLSSFPLPGLIFTLQSLSITLASNSLVGAGRYWAIYRQYISYLRGNYLTSLYFNDKPRNLYPSKK